MIEKTILDALIGDATLASKLAVYKTRPAIFSELAPEPAKEPYITFNITRNESSGDIVLHDFVVMVDIWGRNTTRIAIREASERIEYIFDNKQRSKRKNRIHI